MTTDRALLPPLTRHPAGSFQEAYTLALPLFFSALSGGLMLFVDRLVLGRYHLDSMNAMVIATTMAFTAHLFFMGISAMSEVFVGRRHGQHQETQLAEPAWQMIWLVLACTPIYAGLYYCADILIPASYLTEAVPMFQWHMLVGILWPLQAALVGFFVGQGKTRPVFYAVLLGNLLNILLDILFVFGIPGHWAGLGAIGAVKASAVSQLMIVSILWFRFLSPVYQGNQQPQQWRFNPRLIKEALRIGIPNSMNHVLEVAASAVLLRFLATLGPLYITVASVGQAFMLLIALGTEGLQKSQIATASNFIGARYFELIPKTLRAHLLIWGIAVLISAIPLLIFPHWALSCFVGEAQQVVLASDWSVLVAVLRWCWLFLLADGVVWIIWGVLTAAGDTLVPMWFNLLTSWGILVGLTVTLAFFDYLKPAYIWPINVLYVTLNVSFYIWRYRSRRWLTHFLQTQKERQHGTE